MFMKPSKSTVSGMKDANYEKLTEKGYVPKETVVHQGDVIIGKVAPTQPKGNKTGKIYKDKSVIYKSNVPGTVDEVYYGIYNNEGYEIVKIRMRSERIPKIGDEHNCRSHIKSVASPFFIWATYSNCGNIF
jgi:DNA-directed RNA polymerase II subunit RPB2